MGTRRLPHRRVRKAVTEQSLESVDARIDNLAKDTGELRGAYAHLATTEDVTGATLKTVLWVVGIGLPGWVALVMGFMRGP